MKAILTGPSTILFLKSSFSGCSFRWIKRECNTVAHAAAKLSLVSKESFCFNKDNLPRVLDFACKDDCLSVPVF